MFTLIRIQFQGQFFGRGDTSITPRFCVFFVSIIMAADTKGGGDHTWTPDAELALFMSMIGLRPIGIHRHFRIINIYTRLMKRIGDVDISLDDVRKRLDTLFNMELLEEIEREDDEDDGDNTEKKNHQGEKKPKTKGGKKNKTPARSSSRLSKQEEKPKTESTNKVFMAVPDLQFWKSKVQVEFSLPWADFGPMMVERAGAGINEETDDSSVHSSPKPDHGSQSGSNQESESEQDEEGDAESSPPPPTSPVTRKRRGRSSTPVSLTRSRAKASTATARRSSAVPAAAQKKKRKR